MAQAWGKYGQEDEGWEDEEEENLRTVVDNLIFLVDARRPMYEENVHGKPHIVDVLEMVLEVMKGYIIKNPKDSVGIVLYGTENRKPMDSGAEHVFVLQKLAQVSCKSIRRMRDMLQNGVPGLEDLVGVDPIDVEGVCPLKEALWTSSRQFINKRKQNRYEMRRIWLFTNDDDPCRTVPGEQDRITQILHDHASAGVEVSLFHIGASFVLERFYKKALGLATDDDVARRVDHTGDEGFGSRKSAIRRKAHVKRAMGSMPFYLSGEAYSRYMGVQVFKTVAEAKRPAGVYLCGGQLTVSRSYSYHAQTGATVQATDVKLYSEVLSSGERAYMEPADTVHIKTGGCISSHFRLLYCAPFHTLDIFDNIMCPYFIFPDDEQVKGSSLLFAQLMASLEEKGLIMVASMVLSKSRAPRLVAIVPQRDYVSEDGTITQPNGMVAIPLPFAGEMRGSPCPLVGSTVSRPASEVVALAKELVEVLTPAVPVDYTTINNPALQNFYAVLQAQAIDDAQLEWTPEQDNLRPRIPDGKQFEVVDICGELMQKTGCTNVLSSALKTAGNKRPSDGSPPPCKGKARTASDEQMAQWRVMMDQGDLKGSRVPELKEICIELGLVKAGKKADLVQRISEALREAK